MLVDWLNPPLNHIKSQFVILPAGFPVATPRSSKVEEKEELEEMEEEDEEVLEATGQKHIDILQSNAYNIWLHIFNTY